MALNISQLCKQKLDPNKRYFLDANVWIFTLGAILAPTDRETVYIEFVDDLLSGDFQIWTHSLVFSEVFNALLRNSFSDFKRQLLLIESNPNERKKIENYLLKKHFRGTPEYNSTLGRIKSDIQSYVPKLSFLDKSYDLDFGYITKNYPTNSDFNDYLYYEMSLDHSLTIVTDDGDFNFSDVEIYTENQWLLKNFR
jgi:predicted nucleic acid-binding protein